MKKFLLKCTIRDKGLVAKIRSAPKERNKIAQGKHRKAGRHPGKRGIIRINTLKGLYNPSLFYPFRVRSFYYPFPQGGGPPKAALTLG